VTFAVVSGTILLAPGTGARGDAGVVAWQAPTPAPGSILTAPAGTKFTVRLSAASAAATASVHIKPTGKLPRGARLVWSDGNHAGAVLSWTPRGRQIGSHLLRFAAVDNTPLNSAVPLSITVRVGVGVMPLSGVGNGSKWAFVMRKTVVRAAPSALARARTRLSLWTPEYYPNLALALQQRVQKNGTWIQIRLAILPNNSTGWVKRGALGALRTTRDHLFVYRASSRAVLTRNGVPIFQARVGVGKTIWPTPRGEFYITEKITGFNNAAYGPIAFGTNARSAVLTDWPGGGFIGIHGTNAPGLIPGHVSHGCIRMRNAAIIHLSRLMKIGTPLTVS
jgi:L,D-transpeptidase catalytic domain